MGGLAPTQRTRVMGELSIVGRFRHGRRLRLGLSQLAVAKLIDTALTRLAESIWLQVRAALLWPLRHLDLSRMRDRESILPDSGYLPGNFQIRFVGLDRELTVIQLAENDRLSKLADDR